MEAPTSPQEELPAESPESKPEGKTIIEMHDGTYIVVNDSEVDSKLEQLNQNIKEQEKHATVYSKRGLTQEEVNDTLDALNQ